MHAYCIVKMFLVCANSAPFIKKKKKKKSADVVYLDFIEELIGCSDSESNNEWASMKSAAGQQ